MLAGRIALISLGLWSVSAGCGEPESVQLVIDGTEHSFGTVPYCEDARAINVVVSNTGTGQSGPLAVGLMPTAPTGLAGSNVTSDFRIE